MSSTPTVPVMLPLVLVDKLAYPLPRDQVSGSTSTLANPTIISLAEVVVIALLTGVVLLELFPELLLSIGLVVSTPEYSLITMTGLQLVVKLTVTVGVVPPTIFLADHISIPRPWLLLPVIRV